MILEIATLHVTRGREMGFEAAFEEAKSIVASMPGFLSLKLERSMEHPNRYALLIEWRSVEDHTVGFRQSKDYARWRELLHHFYDPFPQVEHYQRVTQA